jgi:hypothetical protein
MPRINYDIDVEEFLDECSHYEIEEIIDVLKERGWAIGHQSSELPSVNDNLFERDLDRLLRNKLLLTIEEMELLEKIASRFI